jgi:hypothetical protein
MAAAVVFAVSAGLALVLNSGDAVAVLRVMAAAALVVVTSVLTTGLEARGVRLPGVAVARGAGTAAAVLLLLDGEVVEVAAGVMLGLLAAGVSRPVLRAGLPRRGIAVAGLALWALALLSALSLAWEPLEFLVWTTWAATLAWLPVATWALRPPESGAHPGGYVVDLPAETGYRGP